MNIFRRQSNESQLLEIKSNAKSKSKLVWIEILVTDIDRAIAFYENVLEEQLEKNDLFGRKMAFFNKETSGFSGTLVQVPAKTLSNNIRLFFKVNIMYEALRKVTTYGGIIVKTPELLKQKSTSGLNLIGANLLDGEVGYICEVEDSEGNKIFLYSHY